MDQEMAWLLSIAEQYEEMARNIRRLHATLTLLPIGDVPLSGSTEMRIGEAIRDLLARKGPMGAAEIRDQLDWSRVRTKSQNRSNLVVSTLASMRDSRAVVSVSRGKWDLVRS